MAEQYQVVGNFLHRMSEHGKYIRKLNHNKKVSFNYLSVDESIAVTVNEYLNWDELFKNKKQS